MSCSFRGGRRACRPSPTCSSTSWQFRRTASSRCTSTRPEPGYPFRDRDNRRIGDPKTTTAVGGMLCALAESQLTNFTLFTNRLGLRSTAKYLGELEIDGRLLDQKLYFRDLDLDGKGARDQRATIRYYAPMRLGYRQLPLERWIATPLYRLRLRPALHSTHLRLPIEITLERAGNGVIDEDLPDALIKSESMKEEF